MSLSSAILLMFKVLLPKEKPGFEDRHFHYVWVKPCVQVGVEALQELKTLTH